MFELLCLGACALVYFPTTFWFMKKFGDKGRWIGLAFLLIVSFGLFMCLPVGMYLFLRFVIPML